MQDSVSLIGKVTLTSYDANTNAVVKKLEIPNLVVAVGKTFIASRVAGNTSAVMSHVAVGTGNTTTTSGSTTLQTELSRVALSVSGGTPSSNTITFSGSYTTAQANGSLVEAGIFNNSSGGTMLCRSTFPVYTKTAAETLAISWTVAIV